MHDLNTHGRRPPLKLILAAIAVPLTAWLVMSAFAAGGPPDPTISIQPANPTNKTSASFTYTDSIAVTRFECALDGGGFQTCGTSRPSTKSYIGLAAGSHTFLVRAVVTSGANAGTSQSTSFAWTIDLTPPRVSSINRVDSSPTNAATVRWSVTFSEPVTGVAAGDFALSASGLAGPVSIASVGGGPVTYAITASTGAGTPTGSGSLQLRLAAGGLIQDAAGNGLTGLPFSGQSYAIDKTPPPVPAILAGPASPLSSTSATLSFVDAEPGVNLTCSLDGDTPSPCAHVVAYSNLAQGRHTFRVIATDAAGNSSSPTTWSWFVDTVPPAVSFTSTPPNPDTSTSPTFRFSATDPGGAGVAAIRCKLDGGTPQICTSPRTLSNVALGAHTFSIAAIDNAGNSSNVSYSWTIVANSGGAPYTISLAAADQPTLYPGTPVHLNVTFSSPNNGNGGSGTNGTQVRTLSVTGISVRPLNGQTCNAADFQVVHQYTGSTIDIPFGTSKLSSFAPDSTQWPTVELVDDANQNGCIGATVTFTFQGAP